MDTIVNHRTASSIAPFCILSSSVGMAWYDMVAHDPHRLLEMGSCSQFEFELRVALSVGSAVCEGTSVWLEQRLFLII